jgi:short-subunit dehydrogenase
VKDLRGARALVTGASGGIGRHIVRALAREGVHVVASGRRADALAAVVQEARDAGVQAESVVADLADLDQVGALMQRSEQALGPIDVLVNNAGVEIAAAFNRYTAEELTSMVNLNLTAPMLLTHCALEGMITRGRGHVVFIASVAGKFPPAYQGPYAATKAGLIGLTQSLRSEYLDRPIGFSVVSPGFVAGDGMYQRMVEQGMSSNRLMGTTTTERIASKVVAAIRDDLPDVIDSGAPVRPLLAIGQLAPRLLERAAPRVGITQLMRRAAAQRDRA